MERLQIPFRTLSPDIDESPFDNEGSENLAKRLAREKALKVSQNFENAFVIGCDQVLECDGRRLGKPKNAKKAQDQLQWVSGKKVLLYTALCITNLALDVELTDLVKATIRFRLLSKFQIDTYVKMEPAFDCAGGVKIEGLGITLVDHLDCSDPTAIVGLPLISLVSMLSKQGIIIPL